MWLSPAFNGGLGQIWPKLRAFFGSCLQTYGINALTFNASCTSLGKAVDALLGITRQQSVHMVGRLRSISDTRNLSNEYFLAESRH